MFSAGKILSCRPKIYILLVIYLICGFKVLQEIQPKIKAPKSKIHNDTIVDNSFVHLWLTGFSIVTHLQRARSTFVFQNRRNMADFNFFLQIVISSILTFWGCQKLCNNNFFPIPEPLGYAYCHYDSHSIFVQTPQKMALFEKLFFYFLAKILTFGFNIEISDGPRKTSDVMWSLSQILSTSINSIFL